MNRNPFNDADFRVIIPELKPELPTKGPCERDPNACLTRVVCSCRQYGTVQLPDDFNIRFPEDDDGTPSQTRQDAPHATQSAKWGPDMGSHHVRNRTDDSSDERETR